MGRHREALDDLNQAVKHRAARDSELFNARAYGRALAGVELKEALADVEKAIQFDIADNRPRFKAAASAGRDENPIRVEDSANSANPNYLDTRGFILYLLGQHDQALEDINLAITRTETEQRRVEQLGARPGVDKRLLAQALKQYQDALAVMYHHRGQVREKLGESAQAKSDLKRGDQLGYNPAEGVF
jgi:tetratricopeptide (TPR) repeat protein